MESSPSSRISFFNESGAIIQTPSEGSKCGIGIGVPKELWSSISLKLGTTALPLQLGENPSVAFSEWPPCDPGQYELSLTCGNISERRVVTIMPQYFDESEVSAIFHELTEILPKLLASQLQECGGLLDVNLALGHEPTVMQEFLKLRRALTGAKNRLGILQILPIIQRKCHQILVPRHELRDTEKARRPDISKLPQAISMPGNMAASGALNQMFDITVEGSFETYENRLVKAYVQALQSQISRLQSRLRTERSAPPAVAAELEALSSEFRLTCTRAAFLREVRQPFTTANRITMVLLKNHAYRVVWEEYLALYKKSTIRYQDPRLSAPLNHFHFLYQRWANLRVVSCLLQVSAELGYQCDAHPLVQRDHSGLFIQAVHEFEAAIELSRPTTGTVVKLIPWRSDSGGENALNSAKDLPPAVAIAIYAPNRPPVVLVFDAKYRAGTAKMTKAEQRKTRSKLKALKKEMAATLSGIEPMKADVDELLSAMDQLRTGRGGREIQYAAILYPGPRKNLAPQIEALSARPADGGALHKSIYDALRHYLA